MKTCIFFAVLLLFVVNVRGKVYQIPIYAYEENLSFDPAHKEDPAHKNLYAAPRYQYKKSIEIDTTTAKNEGVDLVESVYRSAGHKVANTEELAQLIHDHPIIGDTSGRVGREGHPTIRNNADLVQYAKNRILVINADLAKKGAEHEHHTAVADIIRDFENTVDIYKYLDSVAFQYVSFINKADSTATGKGGKHQLIQEIYKKLGHSEVNEENVQDWLKKHPIVGIDDGESHPIIQDDQQLKREIKHRVLVIEAEHVEKAKTHLNNGGGGGEEGEDEFGRDHKTIQQIVNGDMMKVKQQPQITANKHEGNKEEGGDVQHPKNVVQNH